MSQGQGGGRPVKFKSAKAMQKAIDKHFADEAQFATDTQQPLILTMSGLALDLDMSTECLRRYGKGDKFYATVKKARQIVEKSWERRLATGSATGSIFNLKCNFQYNDKSPEELKAITDGISAITRNVVDPRT